jgi:hypothetical protein
VAKAVAHAVNLPVDRISVPPDFGRLRRVDIPSAEPTVTRSAIECPELMQSLHAPSCWRVWWPNRSRTVHR